jgi:hypothetical protein
METPIKNLEARNRLKFGTNDARIVRQEVIIRDMPIKLFRLNAFVNIETKNMLTARDIVVKEIDKPAVSGGILYCFEYKLING